MTANCKRRMSENEALTVRVREVRGICAEGDDVATASLIEVWIDATERRTWVQYGATRKGDATGNRRSLSFSKRVNFANYGERN
jgi:hypothetical protein